jgi:hypothetical protein
MALKTFKCETLLPRSIVHTVKTLPQLILIPYIFNNFIYFMNNMNINVFCTFVTKHSLHKAYN